MTADLVDSGQWDYAVLAGGRIGQSHLGDQMVPQIYEHRPSLEGSGRIISLGVAAQTRGEQKAFLGVLTDFMLRAQVRVVEALHVEPHDFVEKGMRDLFSDPRLNLDFRRLPHTEVLNRLAEDTAALYHHLFTPEAVAGKVNYDRISRALAFFVGREGVAAIGDFMAGKGIKENVESIGRKLSLR